MALDHYSPCPCGSGKKLKFCKCIDQPQEYEKIVKLMEGDQHLAALDRISQLLDKTPNSAWLLALKSEISLGLQELDTFRETAIRFLKLKPDNPLALIMRSIVAALEKEPIENVARYILEGMGESRESLPALTLNAIKILMQQMALTGRLSMLGFWADIYSVLTNDAPESESPQADPSINLLAKAPPKILEPSSKGAWQERLAEVISMTRVFRYSQAETKLRAILRDFPDEPCLLSHLLRAQYAQLDQSGAYATAKKLSEHLEVDVTDRDYFCALALELEPDSKGLQADVVRKYCNVETEADIEDALTKLDFVDGQVGEGSEEVRRYYASLVGDEVPAKRIYSIFDKSLTAIDAEQRQIASAVGTVVLFGKQTDRSARVLFIANQISAYADVIAQVEPALCLGAPVEDELQLQNVYAEFLRRPHIVVGKPRDQLTIDERGEALRSDFLQMSLPLFDGKSVLEASKEEQYRSQLRGLLAHMEGEQALVVDSSVIDGIYKELDIDRPKVQIDGSTESLRLDNVLDMERIAVADLNDKQLQGLMVRAMGFGATRVFYRCARMVCQRPEYADEIQVLLTAKSGLMGIEPDIADRIRISHELEDLLVKAKLPVGRVVLQRMTMLQIDGQETEARETLRQGVQKHPNDPYLMSFVQYAMQQQGAAGGVQPDLASRLNSGSAPATSDGGIVLPGQGGGAPQGEGGEESKLWLPGS